MFRKLSSLALIASGFICSPTFANPTVHALAPGMSMSYQLPPYEPQKFTNYLFWSIKARCTIETPDSSDEIYALGKKHHGVVNDHDMSEGDDFTFNVFNGSILEIKADSGAQVELTNHGQNTVRANCETE